MTWLWIALVFGTFACGLTLGGMLSANQRSYLEDEVRHWRERYARAIRDTEGA